MALPPPNATTWSTLHATVEARLPHTAFYARLPLETAEDAAETAAIRAGYKNEERLDCNKLVCYCGKRIGVGVVTDCSCLLHSGDRRAFRSFLFILSGNNTYYTGHTAELVARAAVKCKPMSEQDFCQAVTARMRKPETQETSKACDGTGLFDA